jgi:hypothetical protein
MPGKTKSSKYRFRKSRRIVAGTRRKDLSIARELDQNTMNKQLCDLIKSNGYPYDKFKTISPYARCDNKYLMYQCAFYIRKVEDEPILIDVIKNTLAEQDRKLLSDDIILSVIRRLLMDNDRYNKSIILLLTSISPILNRERLTNIYEFVCRDRNIPVLETLRNSGHLPLDTAHKKVIMQNWYRIKNSYFNHPHRTEDYDKLHDDIQSLLESIEPASAVTATTNLLYTINHYNKLKNKSNNANMTAENVVDLAEYLGI